MFKIKKEKEKEEERKGGIMSLMIHKLVTTVINPDIEALLKGKTITGLSLKYDQHPSIEFGNIRLNMIPDKENIIWNIDQRVSCPRCYKNNWILVQSTGAVGADNSKYEHDCYNCKAKINTRGIINGDIAKIAKHNKDNELKEMGNKDKKIIEGTRKNKNDIELLIHCPECSKKIYIGKMDSFCPLCRMGIEQTNIQAWKEYYGCIELNKE